MEQVGPPPTTPMTAPTGTPPRPAYVGSVVALVLGIVIALGVSALFGLLGWGGELASQTAGAASGAAPLIVDAARRRPRRTPAEVRDPAQVVRARALRPQLLVAGLFGFAVLLVDNLISVLVANLTRLTLWAAGADVGAFVKAYAVLGGGLVLPGVFVATYALAVAAGHRLGAHRKRWLLFGIGVFTVVRIGMIVAIGIDDLGVTTATLIAGIALVVPGLIGAAFLGARRARLTQAVFDATSYFRRLPPEDQTAVLSLLDEAVAARRAQSPRSPSQPSPAIPPPGPGEWDGPH